MAAGSGIAARDVGAGSQRNVLRSAIDSQPQPGDAAAADSVPYLHAGAAGDGAGDNGDSYGRVRSWVMDQGPGGLRHYFYDGEFAAVRRGVECGIRVNVCRS